MFIIQTSYSIYLLDYSGSIVEENTYYKCKTVVLQTIFKVRLFLGSRFYILYSLIMIYFMGQYIVYNNLLINRI